MEQKTKALPGSRVEITVDLTVEEVDKFFLAATARLLAKVKLPGFRAGKAPKDLAVGQLSANEVREEAYSLAVREIWPQVLRQSEKPPLEDPEVEVLVFEETKPGKIVFRHDVKPDVKVTKAESIKLSQPQKVETTDADVEQVVTNLRKGAASFSVKEGQAELGDRLEITFSGSIGGQVDPRLRGERFALILGENQVIPGFEDSLIGTRRGDKKTVVATFPENYYVKNLANQKAEFKVEVHEVYRVDLPVLDDEYAQRFGHPKVADLLKAIKAELEKQKTEELKVSRKAEWLSQFEQRVEVDLPQSLIKAEAKRNEEAWQAFLLERQISAEHWLKQRDLTIEQLRQDWLKAAASTVRVGLGVAELARTQGQTLETAEQFQKFVDEQVAQARSGQTKKTTAKPK